MSISALQAAKIACEASGWELTNLALHKILYIANAVYLGDKGEPLIDDSFEAWMYGPVLPSVYHKTKIYGANPIKNIFRSVSDPEDYEAEEIIKKAVNHYKNYPASDLVSITHWKEGAWAKNFKPKENNVIPAADILEEHQKRTGR